MLFLATLQVCNGYFLIHYFLPGSRCVCVWRGPGELRVQVSFSHHTWNWINWDSSAAAASPRATSTVHMLAYINQWESEPTGTCMRECVTVAAVVADAAQHLRWGRSFKASHGEGYWQQLAGMEGCMWHHVHSVEWDGCSVWKNPGVYTSWGHQSFNKNKP